MITSTNTGVFFTGNDVFLADDESLDLSALGRPFDDRDTARKTLKRGTMAAEIMARHNTSADENFCRIKFDAMASHDITYVGITQTALASGMTEFPLPYVLTNCHNSLCAVGGTINEDDHQFGLSAAKKFGGVFVPPHLAVIHQYVREMITGCGRMVLGSDSHTRYGCFGTMGVGEGGPELVKQLIGNTWDNPVPEVIAVYLEGAPQPGVGPQDVALALIGHVFETGYVKNKVLEFIGPGIDALSIDFRSGIDVMTTESACLSSIWRTDAKVREYYEIHGRPEAYRELNPAAPCYYDGLVRIDLSKVEPMIALPFHPSNTYTIRELLENPGDILRETERKGREILGQPEFQLIHKYHDGGVWADQGVIAGCSGGTFENLFEAAQIMKTADTAHYDFSMSVYPASQPVYLDLIRRNIISDIMATGTVVRSAFCGPCFGAGDIPAHDAFSIRHTTRNFPNREGTKPGDNQYASVALMDARSIAATAVNGGRLTPATEYPVKAPVPTYCFNREIYDQRVYNGVGNPQPDTELKQGPNIKPWPEMPPLPRNLILRVASVLTDPVTTTDELIPSGETSSYRSNPLRLSEFTLSRKDPGYVKRTKEVSAREEARRTAKGDKLPPENGKMIEVLCRRGIIDSEAEAAAGRESILGSVVMARKPGDGSAREQAASCQKVLGGWANIAEEYATKRYRSNLINWGILPFTSPDFDPSRFDTDQWLVLPDIRQQIETGAEALTGYIISSDENVEELPLRLDGLTQRDRAILLAGNLINFNRSEG